MKVLHVGITAPTYSSEAITKAFENTFGQTIYFDWQHFRFSMGVEGMRTALMVIAKTEKPDIIFLHFNHNNEALTPEIYQQLSQIGFTITYTEDVREDITWFEQITPLVNLSIFTNVDDVETLKSKGINNAMYLPVSYNDIWYKKQPKTERYYGDIVFLGNNYAVTNMDFPQAKQRQEMIAELKAEFGDKFRAYGNGQEYPMLNPQQAVEAYNNAKIAIGQNNFNRKGYQSDRIMNSMGCGCFTMIQYCNERMIDESIWVNIEQLVIKCAINLAFEEKRNRIAEIQYHSVTQKGRWINRAKSIKEYYDSVKPTYESGGYKFTEHPDSKELRESVPGDCLEKLTILNPNYDPELEALEYRDKHVEHYGILVPKGVHTNPDGSVVQADPNKMNIDPETTTLFAKDNLIHIGKEERAWEQPLKDFINPENHESTK